jgi:hypothetical protein
MEFSAKKRTAGVILLVGLLFSVISCTEPDPLYGRWQDNGGSSFTFQDSGAFTANVLNPIDKKFQEFTGFFSVSKNSLSFKITTPEARTLVTEWDIRGSMLYLDWADKEGVSHLMTLYKL